MRILITGATGVLGSYLKNFFENLKYKVITIERKKIDFILDINNNKKLFKILKKIKPDCIINCAAIADVNFCEENFYKSYTANALIVKLLVQKAFLLKKKPHFIHISTDQLYDGLRKDKNEENKVKLTNNYGITKYLGELELKKYPKKTILRTNFYGTGLSKKRGSFSEFIVNKLKKNEKIFLASNIFFNPIKLSKLSEVIKNIITKKIFGLYNIGGEKIYTKYSFGLHLANSNNCKKTLIYKYKNNIKINKRPYNTVMSNKKIKKKISEKLFRE